MTTEVSMDGQDYCHITGDKGTLCGATGEDMAFWNQDNDEIDAQQEKGLRECSSCGRVRCQECIRLWKGIKQSEKMKKVTAR